MRPVLIAHNEPDDFRDLLAVRGFRTCSFVYASDGRGGSRGAAGARPRGRLLDQASRVSGSRACADPAPPVGALDPGGRVGVRPSRALGRAIGSR